VPVSIVCGNCGLEHLIPERTFDPETGTTSCPACGERPFTVRREGIAWHPEFGSEGEHEPGSGSS